MGPYRKPLMSCLAAVVCLLLPPAAGTYARADDKADIRALETRFVEAFRAKDVNAIMAVYVPDETLVVFDVVPPRQYVGWKAYKKDWEDFLALLRQRHHGRVAEALSPARRVASFRRVEIAAKDLGLTILPSLLGRADEVIHP